MSEPALDLTVDWAKEEGTYEVPGHCSNCGRQYTLLLSRGTHKPGWASPAKCAYCGCKEVRA